MSKLIITLWRDGPKAKPKKEGVAKDEMLSPEERSFLYYFGKTEFRREDPAKNPTVWKAVKALGEEQEIAAILIDEHELGDRFTPHEWTLRYLQEAGNNPGSLPPLVTFRRFGQEFGIRLCQVVLSSDLGSEDILEFKDLKKRSGAP